MTRTILVTGSTDGIGLETAFELSKNDENFVIIHGRNPGRCRTAMERIQERGGGKHLDSVVSDFSDFASIPTMVKDLETRFPKLNVLVCNAGVLMKKRELTKNELEMTFQVNHLAHFALTNLLVPLLDKNSPSRVVMVSSICYEWHSIDWDDLMSEKSYEKYQQYSRSKLMNHLFGFALARRLQGSKVTVNVLEPGVVETKLLRNGGFSGGPVASGAVAPIFLAQSPDVQGLSDQYFNNNGRKVTASAESRNQQLQERLWKLSEELCARLGVKV